MLRTATRCTQKTDSWRFSRVKMDKMADTKLNPLTRILSASMNSSSAPVGKMEMAAAWLSLRRRSQNTSKDQVLNKSQGKSPTSEESTKEYSINFFSTCTWVLMALTPTTTLLARCSCKRIELKLVHKNISHKFPLWSLELRNFCLCSRRCRAAIYLL